jgi:sugar transferase (PEP-CTERM/EpsH1 system associated)
MNILFLTHRLPYAPNRGDRIRAYHMLREMSRFANVSVFALAHDDEEVAQAACLPGAKHVGIARVSRARGFVRGAVNLASRSPLTHLLLDAPNATAELRRLIQAAPPDVVVAYCSGMARFALEPPLRGLPFVLDMVDVDSEKWRGLSERTRAPQRWIFAREARTLEPFEAEAAERAGAVFVVNERERQTLAALAPRARVHVVPNGVDVEAFAPPGPPVADPAIVFCGMMSYEPNVDAVRWFLQGVWPIIRAKRPAARFKIVGAEPPRSLQSLAERTPGVTITGRVAAVQPHLWDSAVAVAPLRTARGIQNKVLEALAAGLPVVIAPEVRQGLPSGTERGCVTSEGASDFAAAVLGLLDESPHGRRERATASGVHTLGWTAQLSGLRSLLEGAVTAPAERRPYLDAVQEKARLACRPAN